MYLCCNLAVDTFANVLKKDFLLPSCLITCKSNCCQSGNYKSELLLTAEAAPSPSVGFMEDMSRTRIMFGEEAAVGQFPHQLSLMVNAGNFHTCGAVLVAGNTALTAAHCVVAA